MLKMKGNIFFISKVKSQGGIKELFDKSNISSGTSKKNDKNEKTKKQNSNNNNFDNNNFSKPTFFNNSKNDNYDNYAVNEDAVKQTSSYSYTSNKYTDSSKYNKNTKDKSYESGPISFTGKVEITNTNDGFKDYTQEHQVKYYDKNFDKENKKQNKKEVSNFKPSNNGEDLLVSMPIFINNEKVENTDKELVIDVSDI